MTNRNAAADVETFRQRRSISPAHGSSVRKLIRAHRIAAGLRPLKHDPEFTLARFAGVPPEASSIGLHLAARHYDLKSPTEGTFARLHPTKGWRFGNAI